MLKEPKLRRLLVRIDRGIPRACLTSPAFLLDIGNAYLDVVPDGADIPQLNNLKQLAVNWSVSDNPTNFETLKILFGAAPNLVHVTCWGWSMSLASSTCRTHS